MQMLPISRECSARPNSVSGRLKALVNPIASGRLADRMTVSNSVARPSSRLSPRSVRPAQRAREFTGSARRAVELVQLLLVGPIRFGAGADPLLLQRALSADQIVAIALHLLLIERRRRWGRRSRRARAKRLLGQPRLGQDRRQARSRRRRWNRAHRRRHWCGRGLRVGRSSGCGEENEHYCNGEFHAVVPPESSASSACAAASRAIGTR
jgi:hypothetical protein